MREILDVKRNDEDGSQSDPDAVPDHEKNEGTVETEQALFEYSFRRMESTYNDVLREKGRRAKSCHEQAPGSPRAAVSSVANRGEGSFNVPYWRTQAFSGPHMQYLQQEIGVTQNGRIQLHKGTLMVAVVEGNRGFAMEPHMVAVVQVHETKEINRESDPVRVTAVKVVTDQLLRSIIGQGDDCEVKWPPIYPVLHRQDGKDYYKDHSNSFPGTLGELQRVLREGMGGQTSPAIPFDWPAKGLLINHPESRHTVTVLANCQRLWMCRSCAESILDDTTESILDREPMEWDNSGSSARPMSTAPAPLPEQRNRTTVVGGLFKPARVSTRALGMAQGQSATQGQ
eukprot:jgi/Botrbrau1/18109/Bobra.0486s0001.1